MEINSKSRGTIVLVIIVIIVVLAWIMYRTRHQTEEERLAVRAKYIGGTIIAVTAVVLIYFLIENNAKESEHAHHEEHSESEESRPEYGVFNSFKDSIAVNKAESAARAAAKLVPGATKADIDAAGRAAKRDYRDRLDVKSRNKNELYAAQAKLAEEQVARARAGTKK
jgi:hypothetical protein